MNLLVNYTLHVKNNSLAHKVFSISTDFHYENHLPTYQNHVKWPSSLINRKQNYHNISVPQWGNCQA